MAGFSFDASFWVAIAFLLFVGLLIKVNVPTLLTRGLDKHADKVRVELETAANLRKEAEALAKTYSTKIEDAEKEAAALQEQTKREIAELKKDAEKSLAESIARRTKAAETRIAQAEQAVIQDLKNQAAELSIAATEKLVRAQVEAGKGADIMDASIKFVKAKLS